MIRSKLDLLIDVEDTGIGIPEDQLKQIFNAFEQTSGQSQAQFGGTGLGLSISQRLVEMMGGEINVDSKAGRGSVFTVQLHNVHISSLLPDSSNESESFDSRHILFHPGTLLVVDDAPDNIGLLRENFRNTSLTVLEAGNGQEAIEIARIKNPDLILMDLRMPVMDGYQTTDQIKLFSQIPVIALTASVMKDEFERAKNSNFDGYLRKPVLRSVLFKELTRFLPYDVQDAEKTDQYEISFSEKDLLILPDVLERLESLTSQWEKATEKNNFAEIKKFLNDMNSIIEHYSIELLQNYTDSLIEKTDAFDIAGIQTLLEQFPKIKNELGLYLKNHHQ